MAWHWKRAFDWKAPGASKERLVIAGAAGLVGLLTLGLMGDGEVYQNRGSGSAIEVARSAADTVGPRARGDGAQESVPRGGRYFGFTAPASWAVDESTNAVIIRSPDGRRGVSGFVVVDMPARPTPEAFLEMVLARTGSGQARRVSLRRLGPNLVEAEYLVELDGRPARLWAAAQVAPGPRGYSGETRGAFALTEDWNTAAPGLIGMARQITLNRPDAPWSYARRSGGGSGVGGGDVDTGYDERQRTYDRTHKNFSDATRGTTTMVNPDTGQPYDVPNDAIGTEPVRDPYSGTELVPEE